MARRFHLLLFPHGNVMPIWFHAKGSFSLSRRSGLRIFLTKLSDARHRFSYQRADGSGETLELETPSFLIHDLVHFALESAADLRGGFYGMLADSAGYAALSETAPDQMTGEALEIETVVGPLSTALRAEIDAAAFTARLRAYFTDLGRETPAWLTVETLDKTVTRFRALIGMWKATPFGQSLELSF